MPFNPYAEAAQVAKLFGNGGSLTAAAGGASRAQALAERLLPKGTHGLPGIHGMHVHGTGITKRSTNDIFGATSSNRGHGSVPISGINNAFLQRHGNGGVRAVIGRKTPYMEFITDEDLEELYVVALQIQNLAEKLSHGPHSLKRLRKMGHPYARRIDNYMYGGGSLKGIGSPQHKLLGRQLSRGISNLAMLNYQTGDVAAKWETEVRIHRDGVSVELLNNSKHAKYSAFGTRYMKPHGPYTVAPARYLAAINAAWLKITRRAYHRKQASG